MDLRKTLFGFGKDKSSLEKTQIQKRLLRKVKIGNGSSCLYAEFWYKKLLEGSIPKILKNHQYLKKDGTLSTAKTEYRLENNDGSYLDLIKTAYDYCCYLLNNNLLD